ncbi:MAG: radical SAM protein [Candidatus Odinarchaeota archaeon]
MEEKNNLKQLVLSLTNKCQLNCIHCYNKNRNDVLLSFKNSIKIINDAVDLGLNVLVLSGGEPFLEKELLFRIIDYVKDSSIKMIVTSNGYDLDKKSIKRLKKINNIKLQISIDGSNSYVHNKIRGKNSFERAIRSIHLALDNQISMSVMFVIFKSNYKDFKNFLSLMKTLNIKDIGLERFITKYNSQELSINELKKFYADIDKLNSNYNLNIHLNT